MYDPNLMYNYVHGIIGRQTLKQTQIQYTHPSLSARVIRLYVLNLTQDYKTYFLQTSDFHRIRWYLTQEVAVLAANALVSSHLKYCNSVQRLVVF